MNRDEVKIGNVLKERKLCCFLCKTLQPPLGWLHHGRLSFCHRSVISGTAFDPFDLGFLLRLPDLPTLGDQFYPVVPVEPARLLLLRSTPSCSPPPPTTPGVRGEEALRHPRTALLGNKRQLLLLDPIDALQEYPCTADRYHNHTSPTYR